ncbi:MAG: malto-oligosyltrehalose trehalohydrolase [Desulfobacteraceae bacterium]|nr:malto-oligosyltrehalose trehalohydrolase [Desulfobacteraceae bacterium]
MNSARLGATPLSKDACRFLIWAPSIQEVRVHVHSPEERFVPLERIARGYHHGVLRGVGPGTRYTYALDGKSDRPDPASRSQPEGVHAPSEVVSSDFAWEDSQWSGIPLSHYVLYELHVGTFTAPGTFDAIIPHLDNLRELGITAIELMPVAQFPGDRNWGYDCAYPFAVQNSYGGPLGLKRLVNACHRRAMAVALDVIYNHLGPEGNYLQEYGPYFTDRYRTPWGAAVNFDGPESDEVRRFFIENALYWVTEFHIDALRLDAVHGIFDFSAIHILRELSCAFHRKAEQLSRRVHIIAESDLNDPRLVRPRDAGGYGLDAQWNDDFHHAVHTLLTAEQTGYYEDFGQLGDLAKAYSEGFVYSGSYSTSRRRRHGDSSHNVSAGKLVVFSQNHDQIGNRPQGDRLSSLVSFEALKLAAGVVILSPFIPLLFMGEEYGEIAPFCYFVSHSDQDLIEAIRKGRGQEFAFWPEPNAPPDPGEESTRESAILDHTLRRNGSHRILYEFYRELIRLRNELRISVGFSKKRMEVRCLQLESSILVRRWDLSEQVASIFHFGDGNERIRVDLPSGRWLKRIASGEQRWNGPGVELPDAVHSDGTVSLELTKHSLIVFVFQPEI